MTSKKKNSNFSEEEVQVLTRDEQRQRVFVAGQSDEVKSFIDNIKGQSWCEEINIDSDDNELAQVNLKYPVRGKQIIKIAQQQQQQSKSNSSLKQRKIELLTSNDKQYNLEKLKNYFNRTLNSLEELRLRRKSSSSCLSSSMDSSAISSSSSSFGELKLLIDTQRIQLKQIEQQNRENAELIKGLRTCQQIGNEEQQQKILRKIYEMIYKGTFEYNTTLLEQEGYEFYEIMNTFGCYKQQIDNLLAIFKQQQQQQQQQSQQQQEPIQQFSFVPQNIKDITQKGETKSTTQAENKK
ncbi:hypothetical protein ABPG72_014613 [Tetrahymena utriculariae]